MGFVILGVDDSVNRIFFEAGDFTLYEYMIHIYADQVINNIEE